MPPRYEKSWVHTVSTAYSAEGFFGNSYCVRELCIPPFLNGMIVHAATDRIKEESILIGWVPVFSATLDQFGNSLEFDKELAFSVLFSEVSARRLYGVLRHIPDPRIAQDSRT